MEIVFGQQYAVPFGGMSRGTLYSTTSEPEEEPHCYAEEHSTRLLVTKGTWHRAPSPSQAAAT
jgi:hypothetical protein